MKNISPLMDGSMNYPGPFNLGLYKVLSNCVDFEVPTITHLVGVINDDL